MSAERDDAERRAAEDDAAERERQRERQDAEARWSALHDGWVR